MFTNRKRRIKPKKVDFKHFDSDKTQVSTRTWTKQPLQRRGDVSKIISQSNRPLIIFPQGTRVLPDDRTPFKKGASRIYEELKINCLPVAINSGYVWPKKGRKNSHRTITISILKPISAGLEKNEFLKTLEKNIYQELDLIN